MKLRRLPKEWLALAVVVLSQPCWAGDFVFSAALGYGGTGIDQIVTVDSETTTAQRSEGPGMASLSLGYFINDTWLVEAQQIRGFVLGPFSSGVTFSGLSALWYFNGPAPIPPRGATSNVTVLVKRFTPFLGLMSGVASGTITRDNDLVPVVTGSGVYIGYRFGVDYPLARGVGLRPEIDSATTMFGSAILSMFSAQCGIVFVP